MYIIIIVVLSRQTDISKLVATKRLSRQNCVCRNKYLYFCRDKNNTVAAPANDSRRAYSAFFWQSVQIHKKCVCMCVCVCVGGGGGG